MIDYFAERLPGVQVDQGSKRFYYDFYESVVPLEAGDRRSLVSSEDVRFLGRFTERRSKVSVSGPALRSSSASSNKHYPTEEAFALEIRRGAEPRSCESWSARAPTRAADRRAATTPGSPRICRGRCSAINAMVEGVDAQRDARTSATATATASPRSEGSYRYLFPAILEAPGSRQITLEFARRGGEDLRLFKEFDAPFALGLGVVDVKTHDVESPRVRGRAASGEALDDPAGRAADQSIPTAACVHLPRDVAFAKLDAMVEGARLVRQRASRDDQPARATRWRRAASATSSSSSPRH